jgi:hypothetical protein
MVTKKEYEAALKSKYVHVAAVPMSSGGTAYVRRPSQEEYDMLQAHSDAGGEAVRQAFAKYVADCFVGALDSKDTELSWDEVRAKEGPAFCSGGHLGVAVNKLAGSGEVPTRLL